MGVNSDTMSENRLNNGCSSENEELAFPPTYDEAMDPEFKEPRPDGGDDHVIWMPESFPG